MWAAIDDDVHSDIMKTIDASRRQRYIIQENRVLFMKIIMFHHSSSNGNRDAEDDDILIIIICYMYYKYGAVYAHKEPLLSPNLFSWQ